MKRTPELYLLGIIYKQERQYRVNIKDNMSPESLPEESKIEERAEQWIEDPDDLEGFMETINELQESILEKDDPDEYGINFLISSLMNDLMYNATEEDYVSNEGFKECVKSVGELVKNRDEVEFPDHWKKFFEGFKETVEKIPKYNTTIRLEEHDNLPIKVKDDRGDIRVSTKTSTYMVDVDDLLSSPETLGTVKKRLYNEIDDIEDEIEKFCFIEKRRGPVGALSLSSDLVDKYGMESMIYRPKHLNPLARVDAFETKDIGEKICIIDDVAVTGRRLRNAAEELWQVHTGNPEYAVVIADMDKGAGEELDKVGNEGVNLRSLYQNSEEEVQEAIDEYQF